MNETAEKILSTSLHLFAQKGFAATSVGDIADEVGVVRSALYKHFESKQAIMEGIIGRMEKKDAERAHEFGMPENTAEDAPAQYKDVSIERIRIYSRAQLEHWLVDDFSADFRRMLIIEQYRSKEMGELFQQYLAGGPLHYMADIFAERTGDEKNALQLALEFYAPMFMLGSLYDGTGDLKRVEGLLDEHVTRFAKRLEEASVRAS